MSEELMTTHLPIEMGSTQHIDDLPYDVLVHIFSFLSIEDLALSVKHVSYRWQGAAQDVCLWSKLEYCPTYEDDKIVLILQQIPQLQTLVLNHRVSYSVLSAFVGTCFELKKIKLSIFQNCNEEFIKSLLFSCEKLEDLSISYTALRTFGKAMQMLGRLQKLNTLQIKDVIIDHYSPYLRPIGDGCPLLQHLDIRNLMVNTVDLKYFMQLKQHQLQSIKINCRDYAGKCTIPYLTVCKTLNEIVIRDLCCVEHTSTFKALRSMKNVTKLKFDHAMSTAENNVLDLFRNEGMHHLRELKFREWLSFPDETFEIICNNCPLLKVLHLESCFHITDENLENLYKLKDLESLILCMNKEITDIGMNFVFKCKNLKYISLSGFTQLTKQFIKQIANLNMLETLIFRTYNIYGLPLNQIVTTLPKLRVLDVISCFGVNLEMVDQLRAEMPHLTVHV